MCRLHRIHALYVLTFIACISSNSAIAQIIEQRPQSSVAQIVEAKGDETLNPIETGVWQKALETQNLISGDTLQTGTYGGLALAFLDRTQIRLHANSRMQVSVAGEDRKSNVFDLTIGKIWSRSNKPDQPITVTSPSATAAIRGTDWYLEVAENGDTRLIVLDGEVEFFNDFGNVSVPAGQSAFARIGEAPVIELLVTSDDRPKWALSPRSDWLRLLSLDTVAESVDDPAILEALNLLDKGQVRSAKNALSNASNSNETQTLNAFISLAQRDPQSSLSILESSQSDTSGPIARLASLLRIGTMIELGELSDAESLLASDREIWGEDVQHLILAAYLEAYAGRYPAAAKLASQARQQEPQNVNAVLINAHIAALNGDDALFQDAIETSLRLAPERDKVWHWYGIYLTIAGGVDAQQAKQAYEKSVAINPEAVMSLASIAAYESTLGRYQKAISLYDQALALDPTEPFALAGKAYVYINMDRLDLAKDILHQLLEIAPTHPETQTILAGYSILKSQPEEAAQATGKVIAASPDRPGAAQLDAQAHWHAGRHDVARKIIANTTRLDPNNPVSALIASIMAQDQYEAGQAISYAKAAWNAYDRNLNAGLVNIPSSQSGRLNIGAPFQNLGLAEQGEYYTSLSASQYNSDTAFAFSNLYPDSSARESSVSQGLMLSPLSVSYPTRFAQFFLEDRHEKTLGGGITIGENDTLGFNANAEAQGIYRPGKHPVAYAAAASFRTLDGELNNDRLDSGQISLRLGTQINGKHGLLFRTSINTQDNQLAGSKDMPDLDNSQRQDNIILEAGYTLTNAWNDRWMFRATGGMTSSDFDNPSALGTSVTGLDFSLLSHLGLDAAQAAATRGIYDTALSVPNELILVYAPFGSVPVTEQIGLSILPLRDDLDPVIQTRTNSDIYNLQTRRMFAAGKFDFSFGLEFGYLERETGITENFFNSSGLAALIDINDAAAIEILPIGNFDKTHYLQKSRSEAYSGHAQMRWEPSKSFVLEVGIFPSYIDESFDLPIFDLHTDDNKRTLDPRIGVSFRQKNGQLRIAAQRNRLPVGIDTIAPLGNVGLTPNRDLGINSSAIDSIIVQLDMNLTHNLFVNLENEYQEFDKLTASLPRHRSGQSLYFLDAAKLNRSKIEIDWQVKDNTGIALGYENSSSKITENTASNGFDIPLVPQHRAYLNANWVDTRFFRINAGLEYIGQRYGDTFNTIELDETLLANISLTKESRDKSWLVSAKYSGHLSDKNDSVPNIENTNNIFELNITKRW